MNYLIYGTSYKLVDEEIKKIIKDGKTQKYDLEESSLEDLLQDISYQSMFDDKKQVIVKNFSKFLKKDSKEFKSLLEYLKEPNPNTILIFISNEKLSSKGPSKELLSYLKVIETPIITKSYELTKLLGPIINKDGFYINQAALNAFAEKSAVNYDIASNEYEKLKTIKGSNKNITESDIEEYVSNYNLLDVFGFKDAVINKNFKTAIKMIDELESSKMELISVVVMLAKEYITLYNVKILAEQKKTNDEIGLTLNRMHPFRVKLLRATSLKYQLHELESNILYLCDLDRRIISEDNLGFDELRKFLLML